MTRYFALLLLLVVCLLGCANNQAAREPSAQEHAAREEKAVKTIQSLGGIVVWDEKSPGYPVIGADLTHSGPSHDCLVALKEFKSLRTLRIGVSNLRFTYDINLALRDLEDLKGLETLDLSGLLINDAGLKHLKKLYNLKTLRLGSDHYLKNIKDPGMSELQGLKNLDTLDLRNTFITDSGLKKLKGLKNLKTLDPRRTAITDSGLKELKGLTNLQALDLNDARINGVGLKELRDLKGLRTLRLSQGEGVYGPPKIKDANWEFLSELRNLETLDLSGTAVTDADLRYIKELKGLQTLDLAGSPFTDAGLRYLKGLKSLKTLDLYFTHITDTGLKELQEALPNTQISGP